MSFGFSPSDIALLTTVIVKLYTNYQKSNSDFVKLTDDIQAFRIILDQALETFKSTHLSTQQQQKYSNLTAYSKALLVDLNEFYKEHVSLGGKFQRKRDKLRWRPSDAEELRRRIHLHGTLWSAYTSSLTSLITVTSLQEIRRLLTEPNTFREPHEQPLNSTTSDELPSSSSGLPRNDRQSHSSSSAERHGAVISDDSGTCSQENDEALELCDEDDAKEIDKILSNSSIPAVAVPLSSVMMDVEEEANRFMNGTHAASDPPAQSLPTGSDTLNSGGRLEDLPCVGVEAGISNTTVNAQGESSLKSKLALGHLGSSAPTFAEEHSPFGAIASATG